MQWNYYDHSLGEGENMKICLPTSKLSIFALK